MDIQILVILLLGLIFSLLGLFILAIVIVSYKNRPTGKLQHYRARFNPSVFTAGEIERALFYFEQEWINYDPGSMKQLQKLLNKINIQWESLAWESIRLEDGEEKTSIVTAELTHSYTLKIWIGPRLTRRPRSIGYTGLISSLVQTTLYHLYEQEGDDLLLPYRNMIRRINSRLIEESNDKTTNS